MKRSNLNTQHWFSTPIWNYKFKNISLDQYKTAVEYCNEIRTLSAGRVLSNNGGWQSTDLYTKDTNGTPLAPFFEEIQSLFESLKSDLSTSANLHLSNSWININGKGDFNINHVHPYFPLSGVFYITDNNSEINFNRNYDLSMWWLDSLRSNRNTELTYSTITYIPERGTLLLFPSWLHHSVDINESDEERISIAFNLEVDIFNV